MAESMLRVRRRWAHERMAEAGLRFAAMGWPLCLGTYPPQAGQIGGGAPRACSCDRIGCPAPAAHPVSPAWQSQATTNPAIVSAWWAAAPRANIILVTGRSFDVLDVPAAAGQLALSRMESSGVLPGPVAAAAQDRYLFFVSSRAAQLDEEEWWSCHLDCVPELVPEVTGLRWHCRDSYVLAPPSRDGTGMTARWIRDPAGSPLVDALRLLELLADACDAVTA